MTHESTRYHRGNYVITSVFDTNHQGSWVNAWGPGGFWKVFITHDDEYPAQPEDVLLNVKLRESPVDRERQQGIARIYQWIHARKFH